MSFDVKYDDRLQKIRGAGAAAIRQLDKLRSTELMTRATFDAEVARIAQENLPPYGCDFVVTVRMASRVSYPEFGAPGEVTI